MSEHRTIFPHTRIRTQENPFLIELLTFMRGHSVRILERDARKLTRRLLIGCLAFRHLTTQCFGRIENKRNHNNNILNVKARAGKM